MDMAQHIFWKNMEGLASSSPSPEDLRYGGIILEVYQSIDQMLAGLLDEVDDHTTIVIMSDHGAGPLKRAVFMNKWLEEQGWLVLRDSVGASAVASLGLRATRDGLRRALLAGRGYLPARARGRGGVQANRRWPAGIEGSRHRRARNREGAPQRRAVLGRVCGLRP